MGVSADFIKDLSRVLSSSRFVLETSTLAQRQRCDRLEHFRWRVDVAISTSDLSRSLAPSVAMQVGPESAKDSCPVGTRVTFVAPAPT